MIKKILKKIFPPKKDVTPSSNEPFAQAIILESDFPTYLEYGDNEERQKVEELEDAIGAHMAGAIEVDGHEFGEGTFTIYLYCKSADDTFTEIESILRKSDFDYFEVTLQYGPPEDPNTHEKKFTFK